MRFIAPSWGGLGVLYGTALRIPCLLGLFDQEILEDWAGCAGTVLYPRRVYPKEYFNGEWAPLGGSPGALWWALGPLLKPRELLLASW